MRETIFMLNFFINCVCVFSIVLETPQNLAVCVGQRTSLICKTSNGSQVREWFFNNGTTSPDFKLYSNWGTSVYLPSAESGYGVDVDSNGSGELYINDTQMENAGRYKCVTDDGKTNHHYAELIVLETEPVCTETRHEDGRFEAECSVNFSGNWAPKMKWNHNNDIYINNIFNTTSKTRVNSKVEAVIRTDMFQISCTILFDHTNGTSSTDKDSLTATNVPDYVYVWKANTADDVSDATRTTVTTRNSSVDSGGLPGNMTMMYVVAAMAFALILMAVVTLVYVCRKRKRKSKSQDQSPEKDDEEMKSKDRVYSGVYDTIEYDAIGYEMPDNVFSHDGFNRSYDVPFKDRVPSGYENPDKVLNPEDDELILLSSQYITTIPDPVDKENTSTTDRLSHDPENKYTPLNDIDARKRKSEKNTSGENERSSYLEIVGDEDELKTTRESEISRKSSSSEGSQEKNKASAANENYTQLMPESGYAHLVV